MNQIAVLPQLLIEETVYYFSLLYIALLCSSLEYSRRFKAIMQIVVRLVLLKYNLE